MNQGKVSLGDQVGTLLPRLRRFARALTRHPQDADDLVQLAVEKALLRSDQWRPELSLVNWMLGIMRNAWIDEIRSRQRRSAVFAPEEAGAHIGDAGLATDIELWTIQEALGQLPDDQRLAVSLVLVEGLTYREAADVMQVPVGTLTSRLARGRTALQALLGELDAPGAAEGETR